MFSRISLAVAVAFAGMSSLSANSASANDGLHSQRRGAYLQIGHFQNGYNTQFHHSCHTPIYKTIVVYKYQRVRQRIRTIQLLPCGARTVVWKTVWRTKKVPVYKKIRIN